MLNVIRIAIKSDKSLANNKPVVIAVAVTCKRCT